jgi:NTP pyrophosphatase (non-canonical NTP hydrolase)
MAAGHGRGDDAAELNFLGYHTGMDFNNLTIAEFQKHISERYEKADRQRGTPKTFLWFMEEVGELATALNGEDRQNLEEEFADVLAWLFTLANINDINLTAAISRKYLGENRPQGHK